MGRVRRRIRGKRKADFFCVRPALPVQREPTALGKFRVLIRAILIGRYVMRTTLGGALALCLVLGGTQPLRADDARAVLAKAIKAHGGADKLAKVQALKLKGTGKVYVGEV